MADLLKQIDVILREGDIPVKRVARGKLGQLQRDAFKLVNAALDIMPGTEPHYEYDKHRNKMFVEVTTWNGSQKREMIGWDENGAYLWNGGKYRLQPSERRLQGTLYRERASYERW